MIIHIEFMREEKLIDVLEVTRLRRDGSFFKWVNDNIMVWLAKPDCSIRITREHKKDQE